MYVALVWRGFGREAVVERLRGVLRVHWLKIGPSASTERREAQPWTSARLERFSRQLVFTKYIIVIFMTSRERHVRTTVGMQYTTRRDTNMYFAAGILYTFDRCVLPRNITLRTAVLLMLYIYTAAV